MASIFVDIKSLGKGTVRFASGSNYITTQFSDWKRTSSGIYNNDYDLKFFINGNLIKTSVNSTNNATIVSSSTDRSFTILDGATTASLQIVFEPESQNDGIIPRKDAGMIKSTPNYSTLSSTSPKNVPIDYFMSDPTFEGVAQSGRDEPSEEDYERGYTFRYLYRQINNEDDLVKEVSEKQYQSVSSFYLYKAIKIKWKIIGQKDKAQAININIAEKAESELKGSKILLMRNPLLYWKNLPDVVQQFDVTQKVIQSGAS